jgi:AcrR family transcriptional regulator
MPRTIADSEILDAALAVIVQRGYAGATTRQIAEAAGINEVTLFRRFGSKKNVLTAVIEQEAAAFNAAGIEYTGDLEADLQRIVGFYRNLMGSRGDVLAMLISEAPRHPELLELMQTPFTIIENITGILARYQKEGALVEEPPFQALIALVGPLFLGGVMASLQPDRFETGMDPADLVKHYLRGRKNDGR